MERFWGALLGGRIVPNTLVRRMRRAPEGPGGPGEGYAYGLGLWLRNGGALVLQGEDSGVWFFATHDPATGLTWTVAGTTSEAAWPVLHGLREALTP
ncbi:hypothetical protein [Cellulomonas sp. S1-8]|uniref:hypothetical protein n=1 Tax=Cellulomonas sp. S1-8 TaxID=2904790 RepID=UPI002244D428|nr:hypothetical protein [Cellulomonas sp. S1-8]UZN03203.1 hypothetical protein OKX07_19480 [Cellulomonas sp. S1-8]